MEQSEVKQHMSSIRSELEHVFSVAQDALVLLNQIEQTDDPKETEKLVEQVYLVMKGFGKAKIIN